MKKGGKKKGGKKKGSYQRDVGVAEGLQRSSDIIDKTLKNFNEEDE